MRAVLWPCVCMELWQRAMHETRARGMTSTINSSIYPGMHAIVGPESEPWVKFQPWVWGTDPHLPHAAPCT